MDSYMTLFASRRKFPRCHIAIPITIPYSILPFIPKSKLFTVVLPLSVLLIPLLCLQFLILFIVWMRLLKPLNITNSCPWVVPGVLFTSRRKETKILFETYGLHVSSK
jgi:hypothetical protein